MVGVLTNVVADGGVVVVVISAMLVVLAAAENFSIHLRCDITEYVCLFVLGSFFGASALAEHKSTLTSLTVAGDYCASSEHCNSI